MTETTQLDRIKQWARLVGEGATAEKIERWEKIAETDESLAKAIEEREQANAS